MKIKDKFKFENILVIYILIQPIIDIITSLCVRNISESISPGIVVRIIFLLYLMIYTIVSLETTKKKKILLYYACIAVYVIAYLVNCYLKNGWAMIIVQIKGLAKSFYFPILLSSLFLIYEKKDYNKNEKYFNITLFIYTACIACGKIFSFGYETYQYKENLGTMGLFYAGNETGAILALISPICFLSFTNKRFNILTMLLCILTIYSMFELGTKVAFCAIISLILLTLVYLLIKITKKTESRPYKQFVSIVVMLVLTISLLGYTSVGRNLNIPQLAILNSVSVEGNKIEVNELKENSINNNSSNTKKKKKNKQVKGETTKKNEVSILSGRDNYLKQTIKDFANVSIVDKTLGMGYLISNGKDNITERKLVEIDYFDIFFCHGIMGTIIYIIPCMEVLVMFIKKYIFNKKQKNKTNLNIITIYSTAIGLGIALMAGHVFTAPAVSLFFALNIINMYKEIDVAGVK